MWGRAPSPVRLAQRGLFLYTAHPPRPLPTRAKLLILFGVDMSKCIQCGRNLPGLRFGKTLCQWCVQHEAAQRGEEGEDAKQIILPAPWVRQSQGGVSLTQILLGVNVAVFLLSLASPAVEGLGANSGPLTMTGEWWRLLTYMFLHSGFIHIAFNMWCLWDLGALCESLYGRATFAAIYLITGVAGGVATVGWRPFGATVGASGAIFGLAGALVASFYLGEFSLPSAVIKGTLRSLAFFVVINVLFGGMFPGVDNACHIGGLISGMILGALIARVAPERDQLLQRAGVLSFVALIVIAGAVGVFRWRGPQVHFETGPDSGIVPQVTQRARS
jgi:rhomboid protease GluP